MLDLKALLSKMLQNYTTRTLLWTNPSPSSIFAAKTIPLVNVYDNYEFLEVEYLAVATQDLVNSTKKLNRFPCKSGAVASIVIWTTDWFNVHRSNWWTSSGLYFDHAYYNSLTTPSTQGQGNDNLIPYKIYGIKTGGGNKLLNFITKFFKKEVI